MRGFSLLELVLSIAIIAVLAGVSVPVYRSYQSRSSLDVAAASYVQRLHRAQALAMAVVNDSSWGVRIATGAITVFNGSSFVSRNTSYDETTSIEPTVTPNATTDVLFTKLTGIPTATASVTLTADTGATRTITINAEGSLQY